MPYVIRPRQLRGTVAALLGAVMLLVVVPAVAAAYPSSPSSACTSGSTSTPFAKIGDGALYTLLAGGSFESGAPGWQLRNAEVVSGGAEVEEEEGAHSLEIEPGGSAVSPSFCINITEPSFRFYARQTSGGAWSSLSVLILWTDAFGWRHVTPVGSISGSSSWAPSAVLPLASKLPLWMPGATLKAQLEFKAEGSGTWAIDDVYIDPHSR
jgi:hypothetical protein